jgi:uncharacterized protein YbaA (DUF1428 family)
MTCRTVKSPPSHGGKCKEDETMADPLLKPNVNPMPFDGKRLIFGGSEMIVEP